MFASEKHSNLQQTLDYDEIVCKGKTLQLATNIRLGYKCLQGTLLQLTSNIRLGYKCLRGTNTLAYNKH